VKRFGDEATIRWKNGMNSPRTTRSIELSGDKIGVPSKNGAGFDDCRNGFKSFSTKLLTDCAEFPALFILELDSTR
jgi:hypothetical protein